MVTIVRGAAAATAAAAEATAAALRCYLTANHTDQGFYLTIPLRKKMTYDLLSVTERTDAEMCMFRYPGWMSAECCHSRVLLE